MIDTTRLMEWAASQGGISAEAAAKLDRYAELLVEWNQKMNLTAITEPEEVMVKHFADSLTLLPLLPQTPCRLIDVGTGAGFPAIPLKTARPELNVTLLDSLNKRLVFLEAVCAALGIEAARVHARAEEGGRQPALRERFDVATARAVASLPTLCEYCLPFVKVGGVFLAMKGPDGPEEAERAKPAIELLGGRLKEVRSVTLPSIGGESVGTRCVVVVEKIASTPERYPRQSAKIAKEPLG